MAVKWQKQVSAFDQQADIPLANAWFQQAFNLAANWRAIDAMPWAQQLAAVVVVWQALANAFRALNLPPPSWPVYRAIMQRWYGQLTAQGDTVAYRQGLGPATGNGGEMASRMRWLWQALGKGFLGRGDICQIVTRVGLDENAVVFQQCAGGPDGTGLCDFAPGPLKSIGCAKYLANGMADQTTFAQEGCDPYDWRALSWNDPVQIGTAAGGCIIARALPPLLWSLEMAGEIAGRALGARSADGSVTGALQVLREARADQLAHNLSQVGKDGLLTEPQLLALSRTVESDIANLAENDPKRLEIAQQIKTLATVSSFLPPPIGTVGSAIVGAVGAIVQLLPSAVGVETDSLGRALPVYERAAIIDGTPSYDVENPPRWVRPIESQGPIGDVDTGNPNDGGIHIPPPVSEPEKADLFNAALQRYLAQGMDQQTAALLATNDVAQAVIERETVRQQKLAEIAELARQHAAETAAQKELEALANKPPFSSFGKTVAVSTGSTVAATAFAGGLFTLAWLFSR